MSNTSPSAEIEAKILALFITLAPEDQERILEQLENLTMIGAHEDSIPL